MFLRVLGVLLLLLSSQLAFSQTYDIVEQQGARYHTGYLPRPAGTGLEGAEPYTPPTAEEIAALPESYDARDYGLVTPIKNQGSCGSCWAFARSKSMEAALIKAGHPVELDLAEQDTLVNDRSSYGCNGGFMDGDFEVEQGQTTEDLCPYRASGRFGCRGEKYARAVSWTMVGGRRSPSVDELRHALVNHGVLAVTVAAGAGFSPNREGRITTCGSRSINHMVNLAGYRPAAEGGYEFLIANSWGTSWGDGGFAWSKQGCNRLASAGGDAALYFEVDVIPELLNRIR